MVGEGIFVVIYVILGACGGGGGGSSGGSSAVSCATAACPANLSCVNKVCVANKADAGLTSDRTDGAQASDTTIVDSTAVDDAKSTSDGAVAQIAPSDSGNVDTGKADSGKTDLGKTDTGEDISTLPEPMTIYQVQSALSSVDCADPAKLLPTGKVILEPAVVTGPVFKVKSGTKMSTVFFVAPQMAPANPSYTGVQVIVTSDTFSATAGDVLHITGEILEFYCMTEISAQPDNVQKIGQQAPPAPYPLSIASLNPPQVKSYDRVLATVKNAVIQDANFLGSDGKTHGQFSVTLANGGASLLVLLPFGSQYLTKDATGAAVTTFFKDMKFASFTGHVEYTFGQWVLRVRDDADIVQ